MAAHRMPTRMIKDTNKLIVTRAQGRSTSGIADPIVFMMANRITAVMAAAPLRRSTMRQMKINMVLRCGMASNSRGSPWGSRRIRRIPAMSKADFVQEMFWVSASFIRMALGLSRSQKVKA